MAVPGFASTEDARAVDAFWTTDADRLAVVTMATTLMSGRAVPLVKVELLVVQLTVCPTGAPQTHPVP